MVQEGLGDPTVWVSVLVLCFIKALSKLLLQESLVMILVPAVSDFG